MTSDKKPVASGEAQIVVTGWPRLLALHRTLIEAKFHPEPQNADIAGSPYIADICTEVLEALIRAEASEGSGATSRNWEAWRQLSTQDWVTRRVVQYGSTNHHWNKMSDDEKRAYVRCALSPFVHSDEDVERIVREIAGCQRARKDEGESEL